MIATVMTHAAHVPDRVKSLGRMLEKGLVFDHIQLEPGTTEEWSEKTWLAGLNTGRSHVLFLQDDLVIDEHLQRDVEALVAEVPDKVIALSAHHWKFAQAYKQGATWAVSYDGIVGNAYVFPKVLLKDFLNWRQECLLPDARAIPKGEDSLIALWAMCVGEEFWHPLPGLWQHDASTASLFGNDEGHFRQPIITKALHTKHDEPKSIHVGLVFQRIFWWLCTHLTPEARAKYNTVERAYELSKKTFGLVPSEDNPDRSWILEQVRVAGPKPKSPPRTFRYDSAPQYDVVIHDTVSGNWESGGSELQLKALKSAIESTGASVLLTHEDEDVSCRTLVVSRYSPLPLHVRAQHKVTYAQDKEPYPYATEVIWCSAWQRGNKTGRVIYPFFSPVPDLYSTEKEAGLCVFPCSANKGLEATLQAWRKTRKDGERLVLANTYQDMLHWTDPEHKIQGYMKRTSEQIQRMIARSDTLFIRNTYEECFPMTVQIAAKADCFLDVVCVGHDACGIAEARIPRDLSVRALLPVWLEALKL